MSPVGALKHRPWPLSRAAIPKLPVNEATEEECTPYYDPARFYPARLGNILNGRYQLINNLQSRLRSFWSRLKRRKVVEIRIIKIRVYVCLRSLGGFAGMSGGGQEGFLSRLQHRKSETKAALVTHPYGISKSGFRPVGSGADVLGQSAADSSSGGSRADCGRLNRLVKVLVQPMETRPHSYWKQRDLAMSQSTRGKSVGFPRVYLSPTGTRSYTHNHSKSACLCKFLEWPCCYSVLGYRLVFLDPSYPLGVIW
jgi:hypothetical protein